MKSKQRFHEKALLQPSGKHTDLEEGTVENPLAVLILTSRTKRLFEVMTFVLNI